MKAEIISIGDELLIGQVINTNAAWMGERLTEAGVEVDRVVTISDDRDAIVAAIENTTDSADVVIMTGGLGPTNDDITKKVLADYFDSEMIEHTPTLEHIREMFKRRGYPFTPSNRQQAMLPAKCTILPNSVGTAPGMWFQKNHVVFVSLPGVPQEMKALMQEQVVPRLTKLNGGSAIVTHTIITHGVGESWLADRIKEWEDNLPPNMKLAYLPRPGMVRLRITAFGSDSASLRTAVEAQARKLHDVIPELIIGKGNDTMESVVKGLLINQRKTLAAAESCTGGNISHLMTMMPGVSACFKGGVVAYENAVKQHVLDVDGNDLEQYGAVSEQVVKQMAAGVRTVTGADFGIATSGIAGPDGGTEAKPVGTVWIALADDDTVIAEKFFFGGSRERVIRQASAAALNMLRKRLINGAQ